jgi:hypothetical protein
MVENLMMASQLMLKRKEALLLDKRMILSVPVDYGKTNNHSTYLFETIFSIPVTSPLSFADIYLFYIISIPNQTNYAPFS